VPLLTYALQVGLTRNFEYGPAVSAFTLGLFYALLTVTIWQYPGRTFALLKEFYSALALLFATVSIPLAIADQWAGTVWALEGACVVWLSVRQNHFWGRIFAVLLQLGAGYLFISDFPILTASDTPFFNNVFLGCTTIALAGIFSSYHLRVNLKNPLLIETVMGIGMIIWGLLWWSIALSSQLINYLYPVAEISSYTQWILGSGHIAFYNGILLSFTFTSVIAWTLYQRFHWDDMRCIAIFLPLEIAFCVYISLLFAWGEYYLVPWIIAFSSAYWILWNHQKISSYYMPFLHGLTLLALIAEFSLQLNHYTTLYLPQAFTWTLLSLVALPIGYMLLLKNNYITNRWPIKTFPTAYFAGCGLILSIYLILWMLVYAPNATGDAPPLTYLPLLNPIDMAQALALLALYFWIKQPAVNDFFKLNPTRIKYAIATIAILTFIWLNTLLMRALHHYAGIPYDWEIMFNSKLTQMTFSIAWIVLAFVITTYASKRNSRGLWYTGGALISVVVIKLFLIDLENTGTIERIIAFVIVGVLLLIIGYIAPIPPRKMD
jgi:uncharacterized membrane protein